MEAMGIACDVAKVSEETLETPHEGMGATYEDVEMVEAGCSTITAMDQVASGVHQTSSEASDGHSGNIKDVAMSYKWKGKASRRYCQR